MASRDRDVVDVGAGANVGVVGVCVRQDGDGAAEKVPDDLHQLGGHLQGDYERDVAAGGENLLQDVGGGRRNDSDS